MSLFRFLFVRFHDSQPHRRALSGPATYISDLTLLLMSLLSKKYIEAPIIDLALLILASISESSLRRGVIRLPKYLNLFVKCTFFSLGSRM